MKKDLISMLDVKNDLERIINDAIEIKKYGCKRIMEGKIMAMIFEKSSTRTRVSFDVAVKKLGGHSIFLSKNEIQLGRGETIEDTAKVLSKYVDVIVYRAYTHESMKELARHANVPVINALDNAEHPCQVIADFMTIKEKKGRLKDINFVYIGDGNNNMAHSYLLGGAIAGMKVKIVSPKKYWPSEIYVKKARELGGVFEIEELNENSPSDADVVATDTWISMGDEHEKEERIKDFQGYTVNEAFMAKAKKDAIFLHCLPAYYGYEVTKEVAHGKQSVIFEEAWNRLWAQMAILKWIFE
ncbi:MAG: ornithine carbamoyltransferase [Thermoplasmatales archaeon]|nr:ornithine carbamoyltransferase [Thermoplasmatales archaeon]